MSILPLLVTIAVANVSDSELPCAESANVGYSHCLFCDTLDLRGADYRVSGRVREGRFSFRPLSGSPEWMELAVAASVDGRALPKFVLANGKTAVKSSPDLTLVYTNAAARAEVTFKATSASLALTVFRPKPQAIGRVSVGLGSATDATQITDPVISSTSIHEFPIRAQRTIGPGNASPPPWLFAYRREGRDGYWSVAWEPAADRLDFVSVGHESGAGQSLFWTVRYPSRAPAAGDFVVPPLVFRFGDRDYFAALQRHVDDLRASGKMRVPARALPAWHAETIACTWRYQRDDPRREQATEANCEAYVRMLEANGIPFGTLIIDDFWGAKHGIWEADPKKWTDLRGFIDRQHAKGRHVLLWVCTDGEGLPQNERVGGSQWDLESAAFQQRLKAAARKMLSSEPGCYDADGVKFDFTASHPGAYGARRHVGCGYILRRFEMLTEACLAVKPSAILDYQCYNPYFTHTLTMLRLNDYFGAPENGLDEMRFRAKIAGICAPGALIDTDHVGYMQFPYKGAYDFFREAPKFGVESLYLGPQDMEDAELMSILKRRRECRLR